MLIYYLDDVIAVSIGDASSRGFGSSLHWADEDVPDEEVVGQWWSDHYTGQAEDSDDEASMQGSIHVHLTDEDDTEGSGDDASMPPLFHGYESDDTDTTVSTAGDEAMERYSHWVQANPLSQSRRYSPTVDWLSDEDSIPDPETLQQALDEDPTWRVRDLEEDEEDDGPPELMSSLRRLLRAEALQALADAPWEELETVD
jgi:hypothetical protein